MRAFGLGYHDVTDDHSASGFQGAGPDRYKVSPRTFAAQLDLIAGLALPPLLTFDDGGASAAATARLLEERGLRGWFFAVTDRIGTPAFATEDELRALRAAGHVVGSHSHTHRFLARLPEAEIASELRTSREVLEGILGEAPTAFSAPRGLYTRRLGRLAAAAGYATIFTSEPWLEPRRVDGSTVYGRFAVVEDTRIEHLRALASGSRGAFVREALPWYARKGAKTLGWPVYVRLRTAILARR